MNTNKIAIWIVGLVIGVTLVTGLLYPTISDATASTKIHINEGSAFTAAEGEHTITTKYEGGQIIIESDGVACKTPTFYYSEVPLLYSTSATVRITENGGVWLNGTLSANGGATYNQSVRATAAQEELTITLNDSEATITGSEGTFTISEVQYYIAPAGEMALTYKPVINKDTSIIAMSGVSDNPVPPGGSTTLYAYGTVDDLQVVNIRTNSSLVVNGAEATIKNLKTNLYQVEDVKISCAQAGIEWACTYTYFLAPHEIEYNNPVDLDDTQKSLIWTIPLMGIVVLIVYAASAIRSKY